MIIYGRRTTHLLTQPIVENCPNCNKLNSLNMSVYQRYGHIFWIPFFPVGRQGATHCSHCQQVVYHRQFNPTLRDHYSALKSQAKTPIWTFTLLIIITLIAALVMISTNYRQSQNVARIIDPLKGDVYELKISIEDQARNEGLPRIASNGSTDFITKYTLYKVDSISNEEVYFRANNYESNLILGLKDLKNDTSYSSKTFYFLKSELKEMFDKGTIMNVDRE